MGKKLRRKDHASSLGSKLPSIAPTAKCKLRLLKLERVKDWLLMEEEFVQNQERLKPQEERNEEDRTKVGRMLHPAVDGEPCSFARPGAPALELPSRQCSVMQQSWWHGMCR